MDTKMEYEDLVTQIIYQLGFVPSITVMIDEIKTKTGKGPSRSTVHQTYERLVIKKVIRDTYSHPKWVLDTCRKCFHEL